jgi:CRISPR-associated protein Cmr5
MSNGTKRSGLEQGRAAFAYQCAVDGSKLDKSKEYKSYVKKMPMLIKTNGLGAAVAFAFAKGSKGGVPDKRNNPWGLLYAQIEEWLGKDEQRLLQFDSNKLAQKLTETGSTEYRAVTIEVLAFFNWLKRFADALIDGEAQD